MLSVYCDKDSTLNDYQGYYYDGTAHEEYLRKDIDDYIHCGIEDPIGLAREEYAVEYHEGLVKVDRSESSDEYKCCQLYYCSPESRSMPLKPSTAQGCEVAYYKPSNYYQ